MHAPNNMTCLLMVCMLLTVACGMVSSELMFLTAAGQRFIHQNQQGMAYLLTLNE
jgi:hypothetical protein